jgi:glyoxylase-like metal-dependent hydrolase (beta-lactamase superfamily II)
MKVHAIRTGLVQVRQAQRESKGRGPARIVNMLFDKEWTEWLPIYAWAIEHAEGVIVVDTGETSRVHQKGYFPGWHPFFRRAARFSVHPGEEIGPQLRELGIAPRDVRDVVLTHLHTDHAGGLAHLTNARSWVSEQEFDRASGLGGRIQGYLPTAGRGGGNRALSVSITEHSARLRPACPSPSRVTYSYFRRLDTRRITFQFSYAALPHCSWLETRATTSNS